MSLPTPPETRAAVVRVSSPSPASAHPRGPRIGSIPAMVSLALVLAAVVALLVGPGAVARVLGAEAGPPVGIGPDDGYVEGLLPPDASGEPALDRLDPALLTALRSAADDAAAAGVVLGVNSGWRSERYQRALLAEAVRAHGSAAEARRWVATPEESRHVTGAAVDIGPASAAEWLEEHGATYGLCRVFGNEPWHFELATAPGGACPALVADATS